MSIIYHLSSRQIKDLGRGTPIRLALLWPVGHGDDLDLLGWGRSVLPAQFRDWVTDATEEEVCCRAVTYGRAATNLSELLGAIWHNEPGEAANLLTTMVVVIVTITPPGARRSVAHVQWPVSCVLDGRRYPESSEDH